MPLSDKEIKELLWKVEFSLDLATKANIKGRDDVSFLKEALKGYDKIIECVHSHPYYYLQRSDVKYRLSCRLASGSYLDGAIDDINKAIELEPGKGAHYGSRGLYCLEKLAKGTAVDEQLGKRIIEDYHVCVSKDPTHPQVWLCLLSLNLILKNFDEAISIYGQCRPYIKDKSDELIRAWLGCAALVLSGDSVEEEDTKPLCNQEIRLNPANVTLIPLVLSFLNEFLKGPEDDKSSKKISEINELLFSHIDNWLTKAYLLSQLGRFEEALKAYDRAIELSPGYALPLNNKGNILMKLQRNEEALIAYNKAIEADPRYLLAWHNKGEVLEGLGRYGEALETYNKLIELNPADIIAWNNKGYCLANLHRYKEALEAFSEVIELNPADVVARNDLGTVLMHLNRCEDALIAYNKALELDPGYAVARKNKEIALGKLNRSG